MRTDNIGVICTLSIWRKHGLQIKIHCEPGPFPEGPPGILANWQYIGIGKHMVLTMLPDKWLTGLLAYQADCPYNQDGSKIIWTGILSARPNHRRYFTYELSPFYVRNVKDILPYGDPLTVAGNLVGVDGMVTGRQYWMIEIPALTREVIMSIDEIVIIKKRPLPKRWVEPLQVQQFRAYKIKGKLTRYDYKLEIGDPSLTTKSKKKPRRL